MNANKPLTSICIYLQKRSTMHPSQPNSDRNTPVGKISLPPISIINKAFKDSLILNNTNSGDGRISRPTPYNPHQPYTNIILACAAARQLHRRLSRARSRDGSLLQTSNTSHQSCTNKLPTEISIHARKFALFFFAVNLANIYRKHKSAILISRLKNHH